MRGRKSIYQERAAELRRTAASVTEGDLRREYLILAQQWEDLAASADAFEKTFSPRPV